MNLSFEASGAFNIAADVVLLIVGFVLIIKGGDLFVDAAIKIARAVKVPEIIIGATVVSIGTTLPELITSATSVIKAVSSNDAALIAGYNSIAVGNAIGSMMCNSGLILGTVMLIKPQKTGEGFAMKGIFLLFVSGILSVFVATGSGISMWEGVVLLALFLVFTGMNIYEAAEKKPLYSSVNDAAAASASISMTAADKKNAIKKTAATALCFVAGALAIALGAELLVDNAQSLCLGIGVPQQIVGITVVAIGTSMPELVTSLTSLRKGTADIGLGNVIGANVINATLLLGLVVCISGAGLPIDDITADVAVWVMLAIVAVLVLPAVVRKKTAAWQGAAMLALYLGFIVYNITVIVI